jgi:hypothetical protein
VGWAWRGEARRGVWYAREEKREAWVGGKRHDGAEQQEDKVTGTRLNLAQAQFRSKMGTGWSGRCCLEQLGRGWVD